MAAIENEPVRQVSPLIPEAQPARSNGGRKCRLEKCVRGRRSYPNGRGGVRFTCSAIVGVQHYNGHPETSQQPETPVFNTLPMMGKASR